MPFTLLPLLLSEVLANEPGSATSLEFVELVARQPVQEGMITFDANGKTVAVPAVKLDSGQFLVICRDAERFEQHFGNSSGVWGDSDAEDFTLQEFTMALPNASGYVALIQGSETDRFQ